MKSYLAWFAVIALAVAVGSLLAAWIVDQFTTFKAAACHPRPRIGFQANPLPAAPTLTPATA